MRNNFAEKQLFVSLFPLPRVFSRRKCSQDTILVVRLLKRSSINDVKRFWKLLTTLVLTHIFNTKRQKILDSRVVDVRSFMDDHRRDILIMGCPLMTSRSVDGARSRSNGLTFWIENLICSFYSMIDRCVEKHYLNFWGYFLQNCHLFNLKLFVAALHKNN